VKRSALQRTAWKRKPDAKPIERCSSLQRSNIRRKPRRVKPGDDPEYKAFIRLCPCVVGGIKCGRATGHHLIDGRDEARKGIGQTAPDKFLIPMCWPHHQQFHLGQGFCAGWSREQRRAFQDAEVERLQKIWNARRELGVWQEPERDPI